MTHAVHVTGLTLSYGPTTVLHDLSLDVPAGSVTAVLGPSGCGKTSLLRVVAGLVRPSSGRVMLGDRVVNDGDSWVPPEHRRIGLVPQEGALFPHLDVNGNVAFALDGTRAERTRRVDELLELVGMAGTGRLRPQELSGGMQQRVAVARALSQHPEVVLLDEPFSALDAGLRDGVRRDVFAAVRANGAAVLLVTHDQDEALSSADRVAVVRDGTVVQEGTPQEVYRTPVDLGVARFVGTSVELAATLDVRNGTPVLDCALGRFEQPSGVVGRLGTALLRPEDLALGHPGSGLPAEVVSIRYHGHDSILEVRLDGGAVVEVRALGALDLRPGSQVGVHVTGTPRFLPH